jgi:PhnB protein
MPAINPYLNFNGNCEKAFDFYQSVFGGTLANKMRFKDMPAEKPLPEEAGNLLMHASLPIGNGTVLMGSDEQPAFGNPPAKTGTNFSITFSADSRADADRIFKGLSDGGKVNMDMQDTFWGAYFGMLTDPFDIKWMVSYESRPAQQ